MKDIKTLHDLIETIESVLKKGYKIEEILVTNYTEDKYFSYFTKSLLDELKEAESLMERPLPYFIVENLLDEKTCMACGKKAKSGIVSKCGWELPMGLYDDKAIDEKAITFVRNSVNFICKDCYETESLLKE